MDDHGNTGAPAAAELPLAHTPTLTLLFLAGILNFLDRSSLSIANGSIRHDLGLSATSMGGLFSAFSLAYGFAQLPIGPLLDRMGARRVLGAGLTIWSVATGITSLVASFSSFLTVRVVLGLGESPFFPAALKLIRDQFPIERRARAIAAINISTVLGQGIAPPLLTLLLLWAGWRSMFALTGVAGLFLAAAWFRGVRPVAAKDATVTPIARPLAETLKQWTALFRVPAVWGLMLGFGGINYTAWFYITWLPGYLQAGRGLSIMKSGWLAALPFLAASLGMFLSGVAADRRVRAGAVAAKVHRSQVIAGMLSSALCTLWAVRVASIPAAMTLLCGALFFIHFAGTSAWGYVQAASPRRLVATVGSIQNFGSFVIASAAPFLTGWTLDLTHSFNWSFFLCSAVTALGALSYFIFVRDTALPISAQ